MPGSKRFTFDQAGKTAPRERYVRVRLSLHGGDDQAALLRADTIINAEHLATLIPVVPAAGQTGRWTFNLHPDSPGVGQVLIEILG